MSRHIEMRGITKLKDCLLRSEYLIPDIKDNDKTPSWDGFIELYKKSSEKKEDLRVRIPVQVKSHVNSDILREMITQYIDKADLINYSTDGGVIFFVVVMKDYDDHRIYYDTLTPLKLKRYIKSMDDKKSLSIVLKTFPKNNINEFTDIFFNFSFDMNKPVSDKYLFLNDFMHDKPLGFDSFTLTYRGTLQKNQLDYFFDHEGTIYANHSIAGISIPVDIMKLETYEQTINNPVFIDDVEYYKAFKLTHAKDSITLNLGNSTSFLFSKDEEKVVFNITIKGTLYQRINDLNFIIAFFRKKYFILGDEIPHKMFSSSSLDTVDFSNEIQCNEDNLNFLSDFSKVLSMLNIRDDVDFDQITNDERENIDILISSILYNNPQELALEKIKKGEFCRRNMKICNISIALLIAKHNDGRFFVSNFFVNYSDVKYESKKSRRIFNASMFLSLTKDDLCTLSNIDYHIIYASFVELEADEELIALTNQFVLVMIDAYDTTKKGGLLETASKIIDWVIENDNFNNMILYSLNRLQINKRKRKLLEDENSLLNTIIKDTKDNKIRTGAYLLLGNKDLASYYFNQLPKNEQDEFNKYPISKFWND